MLKKMKRRIQWSWQTNITPPFLLLFFIYIIYTCFCVFKGSLLSLSLFVSSPLVFFVFICLNKLFFSIVTLTVMQKQKKGLRYHGLYCL
jgi:hypothetical protein